jgi:hypothetical protein
VLSTSDAEASGRVIDAAADLIQTESKQAPEGPRLEGATDGFSVTAPGGRAIEVAQRDDQVVAAIGGESPAAETIEPEETLEGSDSFDAAADALSDDYAGAFYVGLQDFLTVAQKGSIDDSPGDDATFGDYEAARPYLEPFDYVIAGTGADDGRNLTRIVVGLDE